MTKSNTRLMMCAASLLTLCAAFTASSFSLTSDGAWPSFTIPLFVLGYMGAGLVFLAAVWQITLAADAPLTDQRIAFWIIVGVGLAMRVLVIAAPAFLEDDYHRYLWDGAVVSAGGNPYAYAPDQVLQGDVSKAPYAALATSGEETLERINYPQYRTVYPPVTQAFFALAHQISPFSFGAWKLLLLALDLMIAGLIVILLQHLGRSALWLMAYWWNPVVVKEVFNSGHMEPVVTVLVLAALVLALSRRPLLGVVVLGLATAAKLWPIVLLPAFLRLDKADLRTILMRALTFAVCTGVLLSPVLLSHLDRSSGFVAFAQKWQTNSALFLVFDWVAQAWPFAWPDQGMVARACAGTALAGGIVWLCRRPAATPHDFLSQVFWCSAFLFLLSPTQFPWYYVWVAPLLCLFPQRGLLLAAALLPLYYAYFFLAPRGWGQFQTYGLVWLIWLPVWALILKDWWHKRPNPRWENAQASASS